MYVVVISKYVIGNIVYHLSLSRLADLLPQLCNLMCARIGYRLCADGLARIERLTGPQFLWPVLHSGTPLSIILLTVNKPSSNL